MSVKRKWHLTGYRRTAIALWASSAVLLTVGLFGFYFPQHDRLAELQRRYEDSKQQAALAQKAANPQTQQELNQQTSKATAQLNAFSISSDQLSSLMFEIGRMAETLSLSNFSSKSVNAEIEKTETKPLITETWLTVEFQGSYEQFARFMNQLERNSPAVFVEKVMVQRNDKGVSGCTFRMDLSILMSSGQDVDSTAVASAR